MVRGSDKDIDGGKAPCWVNRPLGHQGPKTKALTKYGSTQKKGFVVLVRTNKYYLVERKAMMT